MPAIYPENTQYTPTAPAYNPKAGAIKKGAPISKKVSPGAAVSQAISSYRSLPKAQPTVAQPTFSGDEIGAMVANLQKTISDRMTGAQQPQLTGGLAYLTKQHGPSEEEIIKQSASFPIEKPIGTAEEKYAPLPEGYQTWKTDEQGRWVSPSDKARITTMPESLGGGQYISDPSQPGKLIRSDRGYDQSADNIMRTGLYTKNIQIDHIIPLWAGGADTIENRQLLPTDEHARKTKIQAVPLTLLSAGLINANQAKVMALNWQNISDNYDVKKIPKPFAATDPSTGQSVGMLDLDTAKKLADEWEKAPPVTFKSFLKAIPEATEKVGKTILPPMAWGALKGFAHEATLGAIPLSETKYSPDEASFLGIKRTEGQQKWDESSARIGEKVGGILGFVFGFGKVAGVTKAVAGKVGLKALVSSAKKPLVRGLAETGAEAAAVAPKVGFMGALAAKPGILGMVGKTLSRSPLGAGEAMAEDLAARAIGIGEDISTMGKLAAGEAVGAAVKGAAEEGAGALTKMAAKKGYSLKQLPWVAGEKIPVRVIDDTKKILYNHIAKSAAGQAAYGQLRATVPVLLGYEKEPGLENRMGQILTDATFGVMLGNASPTFKGTSWLGAKALTLGIMAGQNPEDAFTSAISMMALHGLGSMKGQGGKPLINKEQLGKELDEAASKTATEWRSRWLPEVYEKYAKSGEPLPKEHTTPEKMAAEDAIIMGKIDRLVAEGRWGMEQAAQAKTQLVASSNQLKLGGLAEPIKRAAAEKDIISFAEQMKKREQGSSYTASDDLVRMVSNAPEELLFSSEKAPQLDPASKMPNMKVQVTGVAKDIDPLTRDNQLRFKEALDNGVASNKVFLVRRDSLEPVVRGVNGAYTPKEIAEGIHKPSENPWNNVEVWGLIKNPDGRKELLSLGWVPRKFRIDEGKYSINSRIDEINKQYNANFPKYDPLHNKDLTANTMRGMDADISTAHVTKAGVGKESGEPFMELAINDSNWNDADVLKQYYKEGAKDSTMTSLLSKAKNNPQDTQSPAAVIDAMAEKRTVTPSSVLEMSTIPESPSKDAVRSTNDFFAKALTEDNPVKLMEDVNKKFGDIVSPEMAQILVDNKKNVTVKDIGDILYTGIKEGKATPETEIFYKELFVPFFKDTRYQGDNISSFFTSVPVMGRTPADRISGLQAEGKMPIIETKALAVVPTKREGRIAVFEEKFTPENRLKEINDPLARDILEDPALKDPKLKEKIIRLGWKDELTGLLNSRYYHQSGMAKKPQVFLDLDKFHDINGKYGYEGGDAVIKSLADKMNKYFPNRGIRRGGEEFILDVDGLPRDEVVSRLDKIAEELKLEKFKAGKDAVTVRPGSEFGDITFTSSFGENGPEAASKTLVQKEKKRGVISVDEELYNKSIKPSEAYESTPEGVRGAEELAPRVSGEVTKTIRERPGTGAAERPTTGTITTKSGQELRKETLPSGQYWLEQNVQKEGSKWAKLAKSGHKVEHLMDKTGFAGKVKIDGKEYGYDQAEKKFLKPNKIFDSALVAKEAPEVVVTPEVKKDILKSLVTGQRRAPKIERAESIYKDLYSTGEDRLGEVEASDRKAYASKIINTLNGLDIDVKNVVEGVPIPKSAKIEKGEYRKIRESAVNNLKSKALDDLETKFDIDQEISFSRGGSLPDNKNILEYERKLIKIDNKNLLDIPLDDAEKEFLAAHYKNLPEGERPPTTIGVKAKVEKQESPMDRQKRLKEQVDVFGKVFKKYGKGTLEDISIVNTKSAKSTLDSNIKNEPKNSYSYGFARAFDGFMANSFGKDWDRNWGLNSYFSTGTKKGQALWDDMSKTMNENRHPISQPKDVLLRYSKVIKEKPYDKFTQADKEYIYGKRKLEAEESANEPKPRMEQRASPQEKEAMDLGLAFKKIEQTEGLNVTDMSKLDDLQRGRILTEFGLIPDATSGSRDARALFIRLMSEYNSNARHENIVYKPKTPKKVISFSQKDMDAIESKIKDEMRSSTTDLRKLRTENLNERYRNIKSSVESVEKKKKEGYVPLSTLEELERNKRILASLEKARNK